MVHVAYVHGLWMPGEECVVLRHRLARDFGFELHTFRYSARQAGVSELSARLAAFVRSLDAPVLHFLGHSLGGLVIHRLLEHFPEQPPGRAVFLGTPCTMSRAAQAVARFVPITRLMGESAVEELLAPQGRSWGHARELGIIAGSQPLGVGQLFAHFREPNDGTVAVSETRIPGMTDHIVLPVSHFGMLLSARVAQETGTFLSTGRFSLR